MFVYIYTHIYLFLYAIASIVLCFCVGLSLYDATFLGPKINGEESSRE